MRRRLLIAFTIGLLCGFAIGTPTARRLEGPCRNLNVPRTIDCATERWPVPGGKTKARRIAWCESRFNPRATNGRFRGVYQIGYDHEWPEWLSRFPVMRARWVGGIYHGRSNVLVAIRTAHRIQSWVPWSCS